MAHFISGRRGSPSHPERDTLRMARHAKQSGSTSSRDTKSSRSAALVSVRRPSNPLKNTLLDKQVKLILQKIEAKLPCNSGLSLNTIENDGVVDKAVDGFIELAVTNPDSVVHTLCELLEKLQKRTLSDGQYPDDVMDSQLFIAKIIARSLDARWPEIPVHPMITSPGFHSQTNSTGQNPDPQNFAVSRSLPGLPPQTSKTSLQSISSSESWLEPSPLDETVAGYALDVICNTLHGLLSQNIDDLFPWNIVVWEPISTPSPPTRVKKSDQGLHHASPSIDSTSTKSLIDAGCFNRFTMYTHDHVRDEELHGSYFASVPILMRRHMARIIYNLCASNWSLVFARLQMRFNIMAQRGNVVTPPVSYQELPPSPLKSTTSSQTKPHVAMFHKITRSGSEINIENSPSKKKGECPELALPSFGMMDCTRLIAVFKEYISHYGDMPAIAQEAASLALRKGILNWVESFPEEFRELWATHAAPHHTFIKGTQAEHAHNRKLLEGLPERVFDLLRERTKTSDRRTPSINPALAVLLSISPKRCDTAVKAIEGTKKVTKTSNFFKLITHHLTNSVASAGNPISNISLQASYAHLDIVRFSLMIPPGANSITEPSLRRIGKSLAADLLDFIVDERSPGRHFFASPHPIDVNYYAYCQAAIFRFHPERTLTSLMKICLEPGRSYAVMLSVVKALILLAVEAPKYPWQPCLDIIYPILTPRLRSLMASCYWDMPEVIDGVTYIPSAVPICKILANAKNNNHSLADVIDEKIRLMVHLATLTPLQQGFWLYGTTDEDHTLMITRAWSIMGPNVDRRMQLVTLMSLGASITRCLNIRPGGDCYEEGVRYIYYMIPAAIVGLSSVLMTAFDDRKLIYMTQNCLHTLLTQIVEGSPYGQDDEWRFSPSLLPFLEFAELASWVTIGSSERDVSLTAQRCLRLLSLFERHPKAAKQTYFTDSDFITRCLVLEGLPAHQEPISGRVAFQKSLRRQLVGLPPAPANVMSFRISVERYFVLASRVGSSDSEHDHNRSSQDRQADFYEWKNNLFLICCGITGKSSAETCIPPFPAHLVRLLPVPFQDPAEGIDIIRRFISVTALLLNAENIRVQHAVKEALGNELNLRVLPILFDFLDQEVQTRLTRHDSTTPSNLIFLEQSLGVLGQVFERFDRTSAVLETNVSAYCMSTGHFITHLPFIDEQSLRLKLRYCALVTPFLAKRQCFASYDENNLRNQVAELLVDWIDHEAVTNVSLSVDHQRLCVNVHTAVMRLFVLCVEKLHVQELNPRLTSSRDFEQAIAQKTHRYMTTLLKMLPTRGQAPSGPVFIWDPKMSVLCNNGNLLYELVISGIAHLLNNNAEACKGFCLSHCYDTSTELRIIFMTAFTRVLGFGTKLEHIDKTGTSDKQDALCQIVRNSDFISHAIVEICPATEVETIVPILTRLFDKGPRRLLDFLKTVIDREIISTKSPSELLRSNNICTRLLSALGRYHGYQYLRSTTQYLIHQMEQYPEGCSFEIEYAGLLPGENIDANVEALLTVIQKFIAELNKSMHSMPSVIKEVCRYISQAVFKAWPDSKYPALGAFIFLRLLGPAIVTPQSVNITISDSRSFRRGLVLVTKVLQTISNQMTFGRATPPAVDLFITENVQAVMDYLDGLQIASSAPVNTEEGFPGNHESDSTDSFILHQFLQTHSVAIRSNLTNVQTSAIIIEDTPKRQEWETLNILLIEARPALQMPRLSGDDMTHHHGYQQLMHRNFGRSTDGVKEIFTLGSVAECPIFVFSFSKINTDLVDFELLLYYIFKTINKSHTDSSGFDIVFDFTAFLSHSSLPISWLKLALELLPLDIRNGWKTAYILNINSAAQSFLRKVLYIFKGMQLSQRMVIISSISELQDHIVPDIVNNILSSSSEHVPGAKKFQPVHYQIESHQWSSAVVQVGLEYMRISSIETQEIFQNWRAHITEIIPLPDIEDIFKGKNETQIVIRLANCGRSISLEFPARDDLLMTIQNAKQNHTPIERPPLLPTAQTSDTAAALLAIGLLHACHPVERVRVSAYELLAAICKYLGYPSDGHIPWRSSFIPSNAIASVGNLSQSLSIFAPQITLDFILEWSTGFSNVETALQISSLQCLSPWLRNLKRFADPTNSLFDGIGLRKCIRIFLDITWQHDKVYSIIQRNIWQEIGKQHVTVTAVALDELFTLALGDCPDSPKGDLIAETLITLSTLQTQSKLLRELRKHLGRACSTPLRTLTDAEQWSSIAVIVRLSMVAGHSPQMITQSQLYAPEVAYVITMLIGMGPLSMRLAVYGMTTNLLQALYAAQADDGGSANQLHDLMEELESTQSHALFGLIKKYPSRPFTLLNDTLNQVTVQSLERISEILSQALNLGAPSGETRNAWRARWMGLTCSIAFQPSPYGQSRGFIVIGCLGDSNIANDFLRNTTNILKRNLESGEPDSEVSVSVIRCLHRLIPTSSACPKYPATLFWLGIAILQSQYVHLRSEGLHLLEACLETIRRLGTSKERNSKDSESIIKILLDAREPLWSASKELDSLSGLSFNADFGFALIGTLWYDLGTRHDMLTLKKILMSLLAIVHRETSDDAGSKPTTLNPLTMPFFLGLAPCFDKSSYKNLLREYCDFIELPDSDPFLPGDSDDWSINVEALGISDSLAAHCASAFISVAAENKILLAEELENIHLVWGSFTRVHPEQFSTALWHNMGLVPVTFLLSKMDSIFLTVTSEAHIKSVSMSFDLVMGVAIAIGGTPSSSPRQLTPEEATEAVQDSYSNGGDGCSAQLAKVGLFGLLEPFQRPNRKTDEEGIVTKSDKYVKYIVHIITIIQGCYQQ